MKHILVTTDFSELSDLAIEPAAALARKLGAKLTLAHVLGAEQPPKPNPNAPYYKVAKSLWEADQELETQARASLQERASAQAGVDAAVALGRGEPVQGVLELAKAKGADLIVISSVGRTGLKRLILGSVAEEMARSSPIPVLIWKTPPADGA